MSANHKTASLSQHYSRTHTPTKQLFVVESKTSKSEQIEEIYTCGSRIANAPGLLKHGNLWNFLCRS